MKRLGFASVTILFALAIIIVACRTPSTEPPVPTALTANDASTSTVHEARQVQGRQARKPPTNPPKKLKAPFNPATPPSWLIPNWYIDPANSTGCAADTNSCTSASCAAGGVGPCVTWGQIVKRYGTLSPVLAQNTTYTFLSSQSTDADPVSFSPISNTGNILFTGNLTSIATGTFAAVTAKNRNAGQLWNVNLGTSPTPLLGHLAQDTVNSSFFWIYKTIAGDVVSISQPLASSVGMGTAPFGVAPNPYALPPLPELDTIALHDAYTVYSMPQVVFGNIKATIDEYNVSSYGNGIQIQHIEIIDPQGIGLLDPLYVGQNVGFIEVKIDKPLNTTTAWNDNLQGWNNTYFLTLQPGSAASQSDVIGGVGDFFCNAPPAGQYFAPTFDGDIIFTGGQVQFVCNMGLVYMDNPDGFEVDGIMSMGPLYSSVGPPGGAIWGSTQNGVCSYQGGLINYGADSPDATATNTFLMDGGLCISSLTTAYSVSAMGTWLGGVPITQKNLDHTIADGGFGGCAVDPQSGGRICNQRY
jgi:hypothetical protein